MWYISTNGCNNNHLIKCPGQVSPEDDQSQGNTKQFVRKVLRWWILLPVLKYIANIWFRFLFYLHLYCWPWSQSESELSSALNQFNKITHTSMVVHLPAFVSYFLFFKSFIHFLFLLEVVSFSAFNLESGSSFVTNFCVKTASFQECTLNRHHWS